MHSEKASSSSDDAQRASDYQRLLEDAAKIQGVSLGRDAWRRLRRNKAAMAALVFLVVLGLLALVAPLLPLQSPIAQRLDRIDPETGKVRVRYQYLPPNSAPASLVVDDEGGQKDEFGDLPTIPFTEAFADAQDRLAREVTEAGEIEDTERRSELQDLAKKRYLAVFSDLWHEPSAFDRGLIRARLAISGDWALPSFCGTDNLGRDHLARLFYGARVSLIVGIVATMVSLVIGVSYGAISGYFGGFTDNMMMRGVDVLYSIPFIFVVIFVITILSGQEIKDWLDEHNIDQLVIFYVVIGAIYWLTMARVVRGQVVSLKHEQFVEAARTIGAGRLRIVFRHLVPNLLGIVIVYLTLTIPAVMLFEAFLSFLGLGVQPPDVSWGQLANEALPVITSIRIFWWLALFPGLALASTLLALNILGDGLRDALDPRLKNR